MRLYQTLAVAIIGLAGCTVDSEIEQVPVASNLAGSYQSSGYVYSASPHSFSMNKTAAASSTPYTIYVDLGTFAAQGNRVALFVDPVTYKVYVSPAPGATPSAYSLHSGLPASITASWSNSSLCKNIYDPFHKIYYLRIGWPSSAGNVIVEEMMVKQ